MSVLKKATERASAKELSSVDRLAVMFDKCSLTLQEKMVNPGLFIRHQELSYLLANFEVFKLIQNVKGSIFYFGVYHGGGFMTWANMSAALEPFNHTREVIGFDTFSGYPSIGEKDKTHGKSFGTLIEGGFASDSQEFLEALFDLFNENRPLSHIPKTKLIKGDVCQTLPEYLSRNQHTLASAVVLTINLYEPTKTALELLWPRIPTGGVVVIHSLNEEYYPGATVAVLDVLGSNVMINTFPYAPNLAYIVKR